MTDGQKRFTTLSLPEDVADEIREAEGKTNEERIENWAEDREFTVPVTEERVREIVRDEVRVEALK